MPAGFPDYQPFDVPVQILSGGTGSTTGSIAGPGALTFAAGGSNKSVTLIPSGTGLVVANGPLLVGVNVASPAFSTGERARVQGARAGNLVYQSLRNSEATGSAGIVWWDETGSVIRGVIRADAATSGLSFGHNVAGGDLTINAAGAVTIGTLALTNPLPVASGGTGTATPSLVAGTGIEITGSWPNQTVTNTSPASALGDPVTVAHGGTGTATPSLVAGTGISISGSWPNQTVTNTSNYATLADPLPVAHGGTGTATPALVAGANITITGSWPAHTIALTSPLTGVIVLGDGAGTEELHINGGAANWRLVAFETAASPRWYIIVEGTAESGGNAGSDFVLCRYGDGGGYLGVAAFVRRSDGQVGIGNNNPAKQLDVTGDVRASLQLISTVATGTAPLAVTSTTEVANLRAATATDLAAGSILAVAKGGWGSADGSYAQTMKPTVASGTPHLDLLTSGESQPTVRLQRRAILFGPGGDVAPHIQLYHPIPFFVRLREYSDDPAQNEALVFAIDAHATAGKEATLCLHRGEEANGEYLDISNNGYSTDSNYHFVIQKRGTGSFRPFVFQFSDGTTVTDSFHVLTSPLGVVQFAQPVQVLNVAEYADNAAAVAAGLAVGTLYRTADVVKIVH